MKNIIGDEINFESAQKNWDKISFIRVNSINKSTENLIETIKQTHCNGGIQFHKYKVVNPDNLNLKYPFGLYGEQLFVELLLSHKDLSDYRLNLIIEQPKPAIKIDLYNSDLYQLAGLLARNIGYGGAYRKQDQATAWSVSTEFVLEEYSNDFEGYLLFLIEHQDSGWHFKVAWDYTYVILNNNFNEVTLIDITDTD